VTLPPLICSGDCNLDGNTSINELIFAVVVGLQGAGIDNCLALDANADRLVTIDEIISAVGTALDGC
jgi:hypothetical protein